MRNTEDLIIDLELMADMNLAGNVNACIKARRLMEEAVETIRSYQRYIAALNGFEQFK